MGRSPLQLSVAAMLGMIACVAFNLWLFRVGFLYGLVGLNVTKHVGVALLCQAIGVNRPRPAPLPATTIPKPHARLTEAP